MLVGKKNTRNRLTNNVPSLGPRGTTEAALLRLRDEDISDGSWLTQQTRGPSTPFGVRLTSLRMTEGGPGRVGRDDTRWLTIRPQRISSELHATHLRLSTCALPAFDRSSGSVCDRRG